MQNKAIQSVGALAAIIVLIFMVNRFESDFVNPNDGVNAPVGIWKVEDLKSISDESSPSNQAAKLVYSENAKIAQIDVLQNDLSTLCTLVMVPFRRYTSSAEGEACA